MKKVLAITCILVLLAMGAAMASETTWMVKILAGYEATPGASLINYGTELRVGVGVGSAASQFSTAQPTGAWIVSDNGGAKSTDSKTNLATWDLYLIGGPEYEIETESLTATLRFTAGASNALAPTTVGGKAVKYTLYDMGGNVLWTKLGSEMVASTEMGRVSGLAIPIATNGLATDWKTKGAHFQFKQEEVVVPEPSSMLALGSGLVGMAGFVIRRRRAEVS